jgi:hypothetical protein
MKRQYVRSKKLLEACRQIPCQHCGNAEFGKVVAAHSNWSVHGKGGHIKADDNRVAALCDQCHVPVLDQGSTLSQEERQTMWWWAHVKTVYELLRRDLWPNDAPIPDIESYPF